MKTPTEILTAITAALDRLSKWIGRSQAEQAKAQDEEIQQMDRELQKRAKESNDGTK